MSIQGQLRKLSDNKELDREVQQITDGLKTDYRVTYNRQTGRFHAVDTNTAKASPTNVANKLDDVSEMIKEFVKVNDGLNPQQIFVITEALRARAESLEKRIDSWRGWFMGDATKKTITTRAEKLIETKDSVDRTAKARLRQKEASAPQATQTQATPTTATTSIKTTTPKPSQPPPQKKPASAEEDIFDSTGQQTPSETPVTQKTRGAPSRAPTSTPKGTAPTPTKKGSAAHKLITETAAKKKFEGEPDRPIIHKDEMDLGEIHNLIQDKGEREGIAKKIDSYLVGLKKTLDDVDRVIKQHKTLTEQISDTEKSVKKSQETILQNKELIAENRALLAEGNRIENQIKEIEEKAKNEKRDLTDDEELQKNLLLAEVKPYEAKLSTQTGQSTRVPFFPKSRLDRMDTKDPAHKTLRSLEWKLKNLEDEIQKEENNIIKYNEQLNQSKSDQLEIENSKNNGLPFKQWPTIVAHKRRAYESWVAIANKMREGFKEVKARVTVEEKPVQTLYDPANTPLMSYKEEQKTMPQALAILQKTDPDTFYQNAK